MSVGRFFRQPEVLRKASEIKGVDLTAQRHADELQQVIDSNEPRPEEQALDVVSGWKKKRPAGSNRSSYVPGKTNAIIGDVIVCDPCFV